jgi:copper chaperone CopZ
MRYVLFFAILGVVFFSCGSKIPANATQQTFHVWGNCSMCKKTIEKSAQVNGVYKATWNKRSKMMTVAFDPAVISLDQIEKHIANAGYDNDGYRADDATYEALPGCCKYNREK